MTISKKQLQDIDEVLCWDCRGSDDEYKCMEKASKAFEKVKKELKKLKIENKKLWNIIEEQEKKLVKEWGKEDAYAYAYGWIQPMIQSLKNDK